MVASVRRTLHSAEPGRLVQGRRAVSDGRPIAPTRQTGRTVAVVSDGSGFRRKAGADSLLTGMSATATAIRDQARVHAVAVLASAATAQELAAGTHRASRRTRSPPSQRRPGLSPTKESRRAYTRHGSGEPWKHVNVMILPTSATGRGPTGKPAPFVADPLDMLVTSEPLDELDGVLSRLCGELANARIRGDHATSTRLRRRIDYRLDERNEFRRQ
jgi:hypothetical protein